MAAAAVRGRGRTLPHSAAWWLCEGECGRGGGVAPTGERRRQRRGPDQDERGRSQPEARRPWTRRREQGSKGGGHKSSENTVDTGQCHLEIWCQNDETDRNKKRINEDIFSSCSHDQRHVVGRMKQARDKSRAMLRLKLWQSSKNYAWDSE